MVAHALMVLMPITVSAIQVFMDATVIVTLMSVHQNHAEMGELVLTVLPSIIVNVRLVSQVCLFTIYMYSFSLVNFSASYFMKRFLIVEECYY